MGSTTDNTIQRTNAAIEAESQVEIYLDKKVLDLQIDEYGKLEETLKNWETQIKKNLKNISMSSNGNTTYAFVQGGQVFIYDDFYTLKKLTTTSKEIMQDVSLTANGLLLRCENFYDIIAGGAKYAGGTDGTPISSELYLDVTYYADGSGELSTSTEDVTMKLKNIENQTEAVENCLKGLEVAKIDFSTDCELIVKDCQNKERLNDLYESFVDYVNGVCQLNTDAAERFLDNSETSYSFDYTRTYSYDGYETDKKKILLEKAMRAEIHEMGLTDEEIDAAMTKSSFTLYDVAKCAEAICREDIVNKNYGREIQLFKMVLSGNSLEGYNRYGDHLAENAPMCWYAIAKYQMGMVNTEYVDRNHQFKDGDDGYKNYIDEMNAVLACAHTDQVLMALKNSAFMEALAASNAYVNKIGTPEEGILCENYRKNMLLYDAYYFLAQNQLNDKPLYEKMPIHFMDKKFQITGMSYNNNGIAFDLSSVVYEEYYDNSTFSFPSQFVGVVDKHDVIHMDISFKSGYGDTSVVTKSGDLTKKMQDAIEAQREAIDKLLQDGVILASSYAGPEGPAVVGAIIKLSDGVTVSNYKFVADKNAANIIDYCYANSTSSDVATDKKLTSSRYSSASNMTYDFYTLMEKAALVGTTENAVETAYHVMLAGSVGDCTVTNYTDGGKTSYYALPHDGLYTPGYEDSFREILTKPANGEAHGLTAICGWDDVVEKGTNGEKITTADRVKEQLAISNVTAPVGTPARELQEKQYDEMCALIDGGYVPDGGVDSTHTEMTENERMQQNISSMNYKTLYEYFDKINAAYNVVTPTQTVEESPQMSVVEGWASGVNNVCDVKDN